MKKVLLIITMAFLAVSCGKDGLDGRDGRDGRDGSVNMRTIDVTIRSSHWILDNSTTSPLYFYEMEVPELSWRVYDQGAVIVYLTFDNDAFRTPLPYVRHFQATNGHQWTETIFCDFSPVEGVYPGIIAFYVAASDFDQEFLDYKPETMNFRVVLMWP